MARPTFAFEYTGIRVRDLDRSIAFYRDVLGMRLARREREPRNRGEYAMMDDPTTGQTLELNWYAADSPVARPYPDQEGEELDHLGFEVSDLDDALRYLAGRDVVPVAGPDRDGGYAVAYVRDPDGIWVEFYQRLPAAP